MSRSGFMGESDKFVNNYPRNNFSPSEIKKSNINLIYFLFCEKKRLHYSYFINLYHKAKVYNSMILLLLVQRHSHLNEEYFQNLVFLDMFLRKLLSILFEISYIN